MTSLYALVSSKELLRACTQQRESLFHFSDYDCCLDVFVVRGWKGMGKHGGISSIPRT